ncbi:glycosyltransferase [Glutamicibacter sp.]|uniref:glycosyltransferase family 2 protein n=1 Tax=Glutamicibacter sp. TaxID=1931995 RepID=UPI0028BE73D6|nr:glycosyltransferase [Glutamicibacter sp.]
MAFFRKRSSGKSDEQLEVKAPEKVVADVDLEPEVEAPRHDLSELPGGIFISVVIPVYNSMPYLTELLNSLELQDLDKEFYEVIVVDDGSSDFGGEILDIYAKRNENFKVVHQENSGWAGKPRNVGTDLARGEYIFYADSDDTLGTEALRRMRDFAFQHEVDVLVPKLVPTGGRVIRTSLFAKTMIDAPLESVFATLMPQKLIRRSLLQDNNLRFSEEKVRLEDGMVLSAVYLLAKRVSILADYEYYFIRERGDGNNISAQPFEPFSYVHSVAHISQTIKDLTADDPHLGRLLTAGLFKRKGLKFFVGERFLKYREARAKLWISAFGPYISEYLPERREEYFSANDAAKTEAIIAGDYEELKRLAAVDLEASQKPELVKSAIKSDAFELRFTSPVSGPTPEAVLVNERGGDRRLEFPIDKSSRNGQHAVLLTFSALSTLAPAIGDIHVKYAHAETRRIRVPKDVQETKDHGARVYRTVKGALSIDLKKAKFA